MRFSSCFPLAVSRSFGRGLRPAFLLIIGLLLAATPALLARPPHYAVPGQEAPVALLAAGRISYFGHGGRRV